MFKLQNYVPEVYVNESRDFQIFTRVFDLAYNSTKYSINSLKHTSNSSEINSQLLNSLSYKLGLFTSLNIDEDKQRMVLSALPVILRNKGSLKCIEQVVQLFARLSNTTGKVNKITNSVIELIFEQEIIDNTLLLDLLDYVVPTAYTIKYVAASSSGTDTSVKTQDNVTVETIEDYIPMLTKSDEVKNDLRHLALYKDPPPKEQT